MHSQLLSRTAAFSTNRLSIARSIRSIVPAPTPPHIIPRRHQASQQQRAFTTSINNHRDNLLHTPLRNAYPHQPVVSHHLGAHTPSNSIGKVVVSATAMSGMITSTTTTTPPPLSSPLNAPLESPDQLYSFDNIGMVGSNDINITTTTQHKQQEEHQQQSVDDENGTTPHGSTTPENDVTTLLDPDLSDESTPTMPLSITEPAPPQQLPPPSQQIRLSKLVSTLFDYLSDIIIELIHPTTTPEPPKAQYGRSWGDDVEAWRNKLDLVFHHFFPFSLFSILFHTMRRTSGLLLISGLSIWAHTRSWGGPGQPVFQLWADSALLCLAAWHASFVMTWTDLAVHSVEYWYHENVVIRGYLDQKINWAVGKFLLGDNNKSGILSNWVDNKYDSLLRSKSDTTSV